MYSIFSFVLHIFEWFIHPKINRQIFQMCATVILIHNKPNKKHTTTMYCDCEWRLATIIFDFEIYWNRLCVPFGKLADASQIKWCIRLQCNANHGNAPKTKSDNDISQIKDNVEAKRNSHIELNIKLCVSHYIPTNDILCSDSAIATKGIIYRRANGSHKKFHIKKNIQRINVFLMMWT